jgi:hypothetical protein
LYISRWENPQSDLLYSGRQVKTFLIFNHSGRQTITTDHCLVVPNVGERLAVNKQRSHRFNMERFNLRKLNEVEGKEQYHAEVSNRFAALKDLDAEVEINSAWERIRENIKISAKESLGYLELKKHKPWFDR